VIGTLADRLRSPRVPLHQLRWSPSPFRGGTYVASARLPGSPNHFAFTPQTCPITASLSACSGGPSATSRRRSSTSTRSAWFIAWPDRGGPAPRPPRRPPACGNGGQRRAVGEIEIGERLVGQQPAGPRRQHPRHQRPRPLAARQARYRAMAQDLQIKRGHGRIDGGLRLGSPAPFHGRRPSATSVSTDMSHATSALAADSQWRARARGCHARKAQYHQASPAALSARAARPRQGEQRRFARAIGAADRGDFARIAVQPKQFQRDRPSTREIAPRASCQPPPHPAAASQGRTARRAALSAMPSRSSPPASGSTRHRHVGHQQQQRAGQGARVRSGAGPPVSEPGAQMRHDQPDETDDPRHRHARAHVSPTPRPSAMPAGGADRLRASAPPHRPASMRRGPRPAPSAARSRPRSAARRSTRRDHERSASAPISQVTISLMAKGVGDRLMARLISAPQRLAIIIPASVNSATRSAATGDQREQRHGARRADQGEQRQHPSRSLAQPVQKLSTAPSAAPGAIPNSPGSASGLRR
jgi:hypothetical protein